MKHLIFALLLCAPLMAFAFGASEKEQMREDVREALNRARDFNSQKVREATENLARERGALEVKKQRAQFEAEQEELRKEFVRERNAQPSDFLEQSRLERSFEESRIVEDREMDKARGDPRFRHGTPLSAAHDEGKIALRRVRVDRDHAPMDHVGARRQRLQADLQHLGLSCLDPRIVKIEALGPIAVLQPATTSVKRRMPIGSPSNR